MSTSPEDLQKMGCGLVVLGCMTPFVTLIIIFLLLLVTSIFF